MGYQSNNPARKKELPSKQFPTTKLNDVRVDMPLIKHAAEKPPELEPTASPQPSSPIPENQQEIIADIESALITSLWIENPWTKGILWCIAGGSASFGLSHILMGIIDNQPLTLKQGTLLLVISVILMITLGALHKLNKFFSAYKRAHKNAIKHADDRISVAFNQMTRERDDLAKANEEATQENLRLRKLLEQLDADNIDFANILKQLTTMESLTDLEMAKLAKQLYAVDDLLIENRVLREAVRETSEEVQRISAYFETVSETAEKLTSHESPLLREHLKDHRLDDEDMEELEEMLEELEAVKGQSQGVQRIQKTASRLNSLLAKTHGQAVANETNPKAKIYSANGDETVQQNNSQSDDGQQAGGQMSSSS